MNGYVNKQTIIRKLKKFAIDCLKEGQLERYTAYSTAACAIAMTESADVQPVKHGRWTDLNNDAIYHYECSCCKGHTDWHEKFCPNCGARMDGDAE